MRALAVALALVAFPAQADLYRWIDPETGTVKFSSYPPPWYGDPEREARSPRVEVIGAPALARPVVKPAAAPAAKPAAVPAAQPAPGTLADLEARFLALLQSIQSLSKNPDFARTGASFRQQIELYQAVSAELDRQDPGGAARRRALAQQSGVLEQLRKGPEAQK